MKEYVKFGYTWNLYDNEGDAYEHGLLLFIGDSMIMIRDEDQLMELAHDMIRSVPEIKATKPPEQ